MRVYLDVSCLNRPFDDQNQERIRLEAAAIAAVLERVEEDEWAQVSSEIVDVEVDAIGDPKRRRRVRLLLQDCEVFVILTSDVFDRAVTLAALGFKPADALHVAAAENAKANVLLSCDDRLCRLGRRHGDKLQVRICNPRAWMEEFENGTISGGNPA